MIKNLVRPLFNLYKKIILLFKYNSIIRIDTKLNSKTVLEGYNRVENSNVSSSHIGLGTYIEGNCVLSNCHIGKFCSIGENVRVISSTHPSNTFVSTHPAFFSIKEQAGFTFVDKELFPEHKFYDVENGIVVHIGSDVWIGNNVSIIGGVCIGDGAIIGTGAVVTKNVEPYSIVGGVPARLIKYRFDETTRSFLLKTCWWNEDFLWIKKYARDFCNISLFLKNHRTNEPE